ncbi:DNA-methyltransferase [Arachidicoccus terrestris]|uniref:DNA-methyltransferase n=1 Tax=Arachidicoccus terrestris TaxID=2875539 RepID=UPI001CC6125B|nr:site-specific DNA-methyltransferase [Arachidicoccus terrestris]UAY55692.1 site-specific DNA-methyltransferase [Arachidicoccus terrestris]
MFNRLNDILGIKDNHKDFAQVEQVLSLNRGQFKYYNENGILPTTSELNKIEEFYGIKADDLKVQLGIYDLRLKIKMAKGTLPVHKYKKVKIGLQTKLGTLYKGDCIDAMKDIKDNSIDMIFADPPFNLNKKYRSNIDDNLSETAYQLWCEEWLDECVRILKFGGTLFIWNIPKWNIFIADFLSKRLIFKNWIANDIKFSLPISNRLYPSHYSLLYYTKGPRPNYFQPDRLSLDTCRKCFNEIKDYGGYKNKLNPKGMNLSDVWLDIPPVRHKSHKRREGANELSVKLLDRIIEMSSREGDIVFDPFGGSGTTFAVAEIKRRKWIGVEIGPVDEIVERFKFLDKDLALIKKYRRDLNVLFSEDVKKKRIERNIWTEDSFN